MIRTLALVLLCACGSRDAPPSVESASGSAGSGIPSAVVASKAPLKLPVVLPAVDAAFTRPVRDAASFVVIDTLGAIHFGPNQPGTTYVGFEARDGLDPSLDAIEPPKATAPDAPDTGGSGTSVGSAVDTGGSGTSVGSVGGGTGAGFAPPRPSMGLLIRGGIEPAIDTIMLADEAADAGLVTDTIAGLSAARIVGLGVESKSDLLRYKFAFHSLPPRKRGEVGGGVAFVVSARGVTWWIEKAGGASEVVDIAWTDDARGRLAVWAKNQRSLANAYVAIEVGTRVSHLLTALSVLVDAGAKDIELGRRYLLDKDGNVANYTRRPPRTEAKVSSAIDADQKAVLRAFKQRTPQLWACVDKGRDAKPTLGGTLAVSFAIQGGAPTSLLANGIEPTVDACIGDVIREMRFAMDVTVDATVTFPKN